MEGTRPLPLLPLLCTVVGSSSGTCEWYPDDFRHTNLSYDRENRSRADGHAATLNHETQDTWWACETTDGYDGATLWLGGDPWWRRRRLRRRTMDRSATRRPSPASHSVVPPSDPPRLSLVSHTKSKALRRPSRRGVLSGGNERLSFRASCRSQSTLDPSNYKS